MNKKEGLIFKFLKKIFYKQKLENKVIYLEGKNSVEGRFQIEESYECDSNPKKSNVGSDERNTFHRENISSKKFITLKRIKLYREDVFILDHSWGNDYYDFLLESKTSFEAFILVKLSSSEVDILANKLALIKEQNKNCFEPSLNLEDIDSDKHPNIWKYNFLLGISKELNCLFFEYDDGRIEDNSPRLYVNVVDEYIAQGDYYCIDSNTLSIKPFSKDLLNNYLSSDFPKVILGREEFEIIEVDRLYRKHGIYYEPFVYQFHNNELRVLKIKEPVRTTIKLKQRAKNEEFIMKRDTPVIMDSGNSKGNKIYRPLKKYGSSEYDSSESYRYDIKKLKERDLEVLNQCTEFLIKVSTTIKIIHYRIEKIEEDKFENQLINIDLTIFKRLIEEQLEMLAFGLEIYESIIGIEFKLKYLSKYPQWERNKNLVMDACFRPTTCVLGINILKKTCDSIFKQSMQIIDFNNEIKSKKIITEEDISRIYREVDIYNESIKCIIEFYNIYYA